MKQRRSLGFLVAVGAAGLVAASCGGSSGAPSDAGADIAHKGGEVIVGDGGDEGGDGSASTSYDGTTGLPCKTDKDCAGPGGPGINKCSNSVLYNVTNVQVTLLPTPYCVVPPGTTGANCDPAPPSDPQGQQFHYCDGPDDPSSPGICVPFSPGAAVSGQGHCEVVCTYTFDGTAPQGCPGFDTCTIIPGAVASDPTTNAILGGIGYCQGACEKDSDCQDLNTAQGDAGVPWVCQKDIGYCTQHPLATRSKPLGSSCTVTGRTSDVATGACNCGIVNSTTNKAYCTSACIVGGTVPCPDGWKCDSLQSAVQPDQAMTPLAMENIDLPGVCVPGCTLPGDAGVVEAAAPEAGPDASSGGDAGASAPDAATAAACPGTSTCQSQTPNGPECLP